MISEYWWQKYEFKDVPGLLRNPHLEAVWNRGSDEARMVAKMTVGLLREFNPYLRKQKAEIVKAALRNMGIYMPDVPFSLKNLNIYVAAVMEAFTKTGIYDVR